LKLTNGLHAESQDGKPRRGDVIDEERKQGGELLTAKEHGIEVRPKNWLVPVVLVTLKEWKSYGYELIERVARFGFEAMNPGTLYRTLRNMEKEGLCQSEWETSKSGPARRVYSITDAGEAYLDFWARSLEQYQRNIDTFLRLYTHGAGGHPR
jgi:PadR family transcriptional regulator, regulatory protein PadR